MAFLQLCVYLATKSITSPSMFLKLPIPYIGIATAYITKFPKYCFTLPSDAGTVVLLLHWEATRCLVVSVKSTTYAWPDWWWWRSEILQVCTTMKLVPINGNTFAYHSLMQKIYPNVRKTFYFSLTLGYLPFYI